MGFMRLCLKCLMCKCGADAGAWDSDDEDAAKIGGKVVGGQIVVDG